MATKPQRHNYWACELQLQKPTRPRAGALQREATAMRPAHRSEEEPPCTATRARPSAATKTQHSQK